MLLRIANLAGVVTGEGFRKKQGLRPDDEDLGWIEGPVDLVCSPDDGTILSINQNSRASLDAAYQVIDGTGLFATPGLIDPHTHAIFGGTRASEYFQRWSGESYAEIARDGGGIHKTIRDTSEATDRELLELLDLRIQKMCRSGATTVEVKSGYGGTPAGELRLLRLLADYRRRSPVRLLVTFLGLHALPQEIDEQDYVASMIHCLNTVSHERLASSVDSFVDKGFFSIEAAIRFARAAREYGLAHRAHVDELDYFGASMAIAREGAISIDHLERTPVAVTGDIAQSDAVAVLLPCTSLVLGMEYARGRELIDAGVPVAIGSDFNPGTGAPNSLGLATLLAASQMRLAMPEVLCAVTYNAAKALQVEGITGSLLPGLAADVALWKIDGPDYREWLNCIVTSMQTPAIVIVQGRLHC